MTVVDTGVFIDVLRGSEPALAVLRDARRRGTVHTSRICAVELLAGMRAHEEPQTRGLLAAVVIHPVDEAVGEEAGALGRRWLPSHSGIDTADLVVAATARVLDAPLLTTNVRHFPMFTSLRAPY